MFEQEFYEPMLPSNTPALMLIYSLMLVHSLDRRTDKQEGVIGFAQK
jgi:hypothetical protein